MYEVKENTLRISVRNLVEFIFSTGDIDSGSGKLMDVRVMQEGARIHRKLQKAAGSRYHAEVPLKYTVDLQDDTRSYSVLIEGRADGIICDLQENDQGDKIPISDVIIDEIKTVGSDVHRMDEPVYVHKAQAMCYGYIYASHKALSSIAIQLTYCNPETEDIKQFKEELSYDELKNWFESLIASFKLWSDFVFRSREERQNSIENVEFPFTYRPGQKNLCIGVYRSIEREKNLFIQASTGVGKTISTIFPAVKAMGQGMADKIFYLTSKTITRTVAQDTFKILRDQGLIFRNVTLTARDKICPLEERNCNPRDCSRAKGHYDRVNDAVYHLVTENMVIDRQVVEKYAEMFNVCPFEMGLDASYWCDGIICDYNYVFDPDVSLKRYFAQGQKGDYIFLVDEAHNLVDRAREMYSAVLVKEDVLAARRLLAGDKNEGEGFHNKKLLSQLEKVNKHLLGMKRECDTVKILGGPESMGRLPEYLTNLGIGIMDFLDKNKNYVHRKELLDFFFEINGFLNCYDRLDEKYVCYTEHDETGNFCLNLFCVDPSCNLSERLAMGRSTIFFSATLLPVNYFKEMLTGCLDDYAVYAQASFPAERRKVIVGRDVSSRYTRRNHAEYMKICRYIDNTIKTHPGKYMVFFPSYSYMENVYDIYVKEYSPDVVENMEQEDIFLKESTKVILQKSDMREGDREGFLNVFNERLCKGSLVGFCVTGGVFSEGIDLREENLVGAVVVGTGLPMICRKRDILKDYFNNCGKDGFAYSYVYPGMNKVLQAAGRVIRTSEDVGVIELLDDRFLNSDYAGMFPREWNNIEITDLHGVKDVLEDFWENI